MEEIRTIVAIEKRIEDISERLSQLAILLREERRKIEKLEKLIYDRMSSTDKLDARMSALESVVFGDASKQTDGLIKSVEELSNVTRDLIADLTDRDGRSRFKGITKAINENGNKIDSLIAELKEKSIQEEARKDIAEGVLSTVKWTGIIIGVILSGIEIIRLFLVIGG